MLESLTLSFCTGSKLAIQIGLGLQLLSSKQEYIWVPVEEKREREESRGGADQAGCAMAPRNSGSLRCGSGSGDGERRGGASCWPRATLDR